MSANETGLHHLEDYEAGEPNHELFLALQTDRLPLQITYTSDIAEQRRQVKWLLDRDQFMPSWTLAQYYWNVDEDLGAFIRKEAPERLVEIAQFFQANPDRQRYMWGVKGDVPTA